jgi:preprotein translocase subunit SecG
MSWLLNLVVVVQVLSALTMIGLVLVQHGKGADMGASFGSGASGSLFGATGSANFLSRMTAVCATVFFACTLGLAYIAHAGGRAPASEGGSVLEQPAQTVPATGAAQVPAAGATPAPAPAASAASVPVPATAASAALPRASGTP